MFRKPLLGSVWLTTLLLISTIGSAQTYLGITADVGNRVDYQPTTGQTYFQSANTVSGSITFLQQKGIRNNWFFQYGLAGGILGYNIKVLLKDTLSPHFTSPETFVNYPNLYVSVPIAIGKQFLVKENKVTVFYGMGATYYINLYSEGDYGALGDMDISNYSIEWLFDYETFHSENKIVAFAELSTQVELNQRVTVGFMYRHHFKPFIEGTYNFYHVSEPSNGTLSVTQKNLSILFLVRLGKSA
jgi:hypothetical protein